MEVQVMLWTLAVVALIAIGAAITWGVKTVRKLREKREVPVETPEHPIAQTPLERVAAERRAAAEDEEAGTARARRLQMQAIRAEAEIPVDEEAQVDKLIADQRLRASDLKVETEMNLGWADLNEEAALKLRNARRVRRMRWMQELPNFYDQVFGTATTAATPTALRSLTINGNAIAQGQTQVTIPGGTVTINPAPGAQGYDEGTQVSLTVNPTATGSTVVVQGAARRGQAWMVTLDRDRQVTVTITPPARPQGGQGAGAGAGGGAIPVPTPTP